MDPSKVKSTLKDAREAIKNKDFKNAVKLCKVVLAADRSNYNGLVLFGVALQETDQKEQAEKAFKKAISVSPNQSLAYQGLISYYEKIDTRTKDQDQELLSAYQKLLSLESDAIKFKDTCEKMTLLAQKFLSTEACISTLSNVSYDKTNDVLCKVVKKNMLHTLLQAKDMSSHHEDIMKEMLVSFLQDPQISAEENFEYHKKYFRLLYKQKENANLLQEAKDFHNRVPNAEFALEWICKVFSEDIAIGKSSSLAVEDISQYCDTLIALNPASSMALLAKGALLVDSGSFYEASEVLKSVCDLLPQSTQLWSFLSQCYLRMHCFLDAALCASRACTILNKQSAPNEILLREQSILQATALSWQNTEEAANQTINGCRELLEIYPDEPELIMSLARAYFRLDECKQTANDFVAAQNTNARLTETQRALLNAMHLRSNLDVMDAIKVLSAQASKDEASFELWLELGKLYVRENEVELGLQSLLKATKLAPYCLSCFVQLGLAYGADGKQLDKARRCFLKALQLDPRNSEAGVALADIYQRLGNQEAYLAMLRNATAQPDSCGANKWAWLRLGMHELRLKNYETAINSLLAVIRADPTDSHCWETLGDAYAARGSYTSALKSYGRVRQLDPQSLYPMYQIAHIKFTLGLFEEAAEQFGKILSIDATYVAAMVGLGQTYLSLGKCYLNKQLLGACRDHCQKALDILTSASVERRDLSCVWKLLGDVCSLAARLPEPRATLDVPALLRQDSDVNADSKQALLELAARLYCRALALGSDVTSLVWQDLAVNYHAQADNATVPETRTKMRTWALAAAKHSVSVNPKSWQHWNTLGIIAASEEVCNYRLAQHAFIKSVRQTDGKNAVPWANLGTLYLSLEHMKLANKAFKMAQRVDPSYIQSWIGQALIAEKTGHHDAMDLFRHTTELGIHPESCVGYANWVVSILLRSTESTKTDPDFIYSIEKMHAVAVATDAISWYTGMVEKDPCALNLLGILLERQGIHAGAAKAFCASLRILEAEEGAAMPTDCVRTNLARVLAEMKQHDAAIKQYQLVSEANFNTQCGLALTYFKAEMYEESHSAYETALHWLAPDDGFKSHVLVAMAAMAYMFQSVEDSQTVLYQCITLKPPSVQGLFAACALGMLHSDLGLSELVLKELEIHKDEPKYLTDIATFQAYALYLQGDSAGAVRVLARCVHRHPAQASLWLALALLMLHDFPRHDACAAGRCAHAAIILGRNQMDVTKVMSLVSLSALLSGKSTASLRSSQKAVHTYPDVAENWVALTAAFYPRCMAQRSPADAIWLARVVGFVRARMDITRSLTKWLAGYEQAVSALTDKILAESMEAS